MPGEGPARGSIGKGPAALRREQAGDERVESPPIGAGLGQPERRALRASLMDLEQEHDEHRRAALQRPRFVDPGGPQACKRRPGR